MANIDHNKAKRVSFTWKVMHEDLLLREVLLLEPFQYRQGTKERGTAWTKMTERVGETRRRHSGENDEITLERKQQRRNSDVIEMLKGSLEMKRKEQEQAGQLREREITLMERQFQCQDEFQRAMIKQQLEQQQQAVTMSMLNTLAEITKNLKK